jgi:AraC-like DNA-binding protein
MKYKNIAEEVAVYIISRNLKELSQLTRYKIAQHFSINQNYLSEKFKKETQMTVWKFLNFEKMKRAEFLLRARRNLSVADISRMVGCEKSQLFRKNFKKIFGVNPGKYRNIAIKPPPFCVNRKNRCLPIQKQQPSLTPG